MLKKSLFLILSLIIAFFMFAESSEEIAKALQDKYAGVESKINDIVLEQKLMTFDDDENVEMDMKMYSKADKFRLETIISIDSEDMEDDGISINEMKTTIIGDGNKTWVIAPFVGKIEMEDDDEQGEQVEYAEMVFWWNDIGEDMELVREEKFDGKDCYVMQYSDDNEDENLVWVEKSTMNILKMQDKNDAESYILFKDYKKLIDDSEIPYLVEAYDDGDKEMEMKVNNVKVNKGIDDDMFNPDKVENSNNGININIPKLFGN